MLRNYLLITWRNLKRNPLYLGLNILGLSIGIAATLLVWQYVIFEKNYDTHLTEGKELYRVHLDRYDAGELSTQWSGGAATVGNAMKEQFPEVLDFGKLHAKSSICEYEDKVFREPDCYFGMSSLIDLFSLKTVYGDPKAGLERPYTLVMTESTAKKYFGNEDPTGKQITVSGTGEIEVAGVVEDLPADTHLGFNILVSYPTMIKTWSEDVETAWYWDGFLTYVQLQEGTDPVELAQKLNDFVAENQKEQLEAYNHKMLFSLMPVKDIHLTSNFLEEFKPNGDAKTVGFLTIIGFLIIIIAWINYINLSTARAVDRGKEVGVRKTNGATKSHLVGQFLFEALVINVVAAIIGLYIYQLTNPYLDLLAGRESGFTLWDLPYFIPVLLLVTFVGAFISGFYPAMVLSSFNPANSLKGTFNLPNTGATPLFSHNQLRKGLVIFQFATSIILIGATFTIFRQLSFMQDHEKGVSLEQILVVRGPAVTDSTYNDKMASFINTMENTAGVSASATSSSVPGITDKFNVGGTRLWGQPASEGVQFDRQWINPQYMDLYGIEIIAGENFSLEAFKDSNYTMLNEAGVAHLGFSSPEEAIGVEINQWGDKLKVKGVFKDYFHRSLKNNPLPTLYRYYPYVGDYQSFEVETASLEQVIPHMQESFEQTFPGNPFEYFFADEKYGQLYKAEQTSGKIFSLFSLLAVAVACLGLFGLISYALVRRTKEIGIRKVLGATYQHILGLLLKDFLFLVIFAGLIAVPFTYWAITSWLQEYPTRIGLQVDLFILPVIMVMGLALLTILRSTIISAQAKPVDSLRVE
ncbi:MAG: FtsX-like permease family protein [Bacteroidota bacterium]